ncbi:MAG: hypothetical protein V4820_13465 [Pseudomonadota bacterium]
MLDPRPFVLAAALTFALAAPASAAPAIPAGAGLHHQGRRGQDPLPG